MLKKNGTEITKTHTYIFSTSSKCRVGKIAASQHIPCEESEAIAHESDPQSQCLHPLLMPTDSEHILHNLWISHLRIPYRCAGQASHPSHYSDIFNSNTEKKKLIPEYKRKREKNNYS